ncbi:MAG: hypothetical protein ACOH2L_16975 [Devosia sp.]
MIASNYPNAAVAILIECIDSRDDTHLDMVVEILGTLQFTPDATILMAFERTLMGEVSLAKATGKLVLKKATEGDLSNGTWLGPIIKYWEDNEKPYPMSGGVVPESPRPDLLRALFVLGELSDESLISLLGDPRGDVVTFAKETLLSRKAASPGLTRQIVDAVHARTMGPSVASQLFHQMPELGAIAKDVVAIGTVECFAAIVGHHDGISDLKCRLCPDRAPCLAFEGTQH